MKYAVLETNQSPRNLVGVHQSSSTAVPMSNLALGSLHRSKPNIASSTMFKDAQQLYYSGTLQLRSSLLGVTLQFRNTLISCYNL